MGGEKERKFTISLSEADFEYLKREYGSVGKGVRSLIKAARERLPHPSKPTLRTAYFALMQACEAEGEIKYRNALETIMKELKAPMEEAQKIIGELCGEGFVETSKTGWLRVGDFRPKLERELKRLSGIAPS
jgi:hypothetical protein